MMGRLECMGIHPNDIDRADENMFEVLERLHFTDDELNEVEDEINNIPQNFKLNSIEFQTDTVITDIFMQGFDAIGRKFGSYFKTHDIYKEVQYDINGFGSTFYVSETLQEYADKQFKKKKPNKH